MWPKTRMKTGASLPSHVVVYSLVLIIYSLRLTDNELREIKMKAKWLRRACQPFHELETIISVGLESRATTQHLIEPGTREYITDL